MGTTLDINSPALLGGFKTAVDTYIDITFSRPMHRERPVNVSSNDLPDLHFMHFDYETIVCFLYLHWTDC